MIGGYFNQSQVTFIFRLKFKAVFVAKMFRVLSPSVLNFYSKLKFKTFFYFKLCIKTC